MREFIDLMEKVLKKDQRDLLRYVTDHFDGLLLCMEVFPLMLMGDRHMYVFFFFFLNTANSLNIRIQTNIR